MNCYLFVIFEQFLHINIKFETYKNAFKLTVVKAYKHGSHACPVERAHTKDTRLDL